MADTLKNIKLTANTWVDLYAASGIAIGTQITAQNLTTIPAKLHTSLAQPTSTDAKSDDTGSFYRLLSYGKEFNSHGASGAWAYSHSDGLINITETTAALAGNGGSDSEYGLNIQRGLVDGVDVVHIFGRNPDIDNSGVFEDVWNGGGEYTGFNATSAETISISSSSAADTNVTGTGAWLMQVVGLDNDFKEINEILPLNGTSPVLTVNAYRRCSVAIILSAGSSGENVGVITGGQSTTVANIFFAMAETSNRTMICVYTVPFGKTAYITNGFATLARKGNASSEIKASVRYPGSVFQVVEWFAVDGAGSSYVHRDFEIPLIGIPTGTDVRVQADADTNNTGIAAGLEILTALI